MGSAFALSIALSALFSLSACSSTLLAPRHPVAPAAVDRLLSGDETLHAEAKVEIRSLGSGAMPELRERFHEGTSEQRASIIELATTIGKPEPILIDLLREAARDNSSAVRELVAFRAAKREDLYPLLSPIILPLIWDTDPQVQSAAITSLAVFPPELSITDRDLEILMHARSPLVVAAATSVALARPSGSLHRLALEVLPDLVGEMMNPSPLIRAAVIIAIGKYGRAAELATAPLSGSLSYDSIPDVRLQAAIALLRIHTPSAVEVAVPALREFSKSKDPALADLARNALKELMQ